MAPLNPFEDAPEQAAAYDDPEAEESLQPELTAEDGLEEDDGTDADSVQEIVLDPGMGHLIAGGFGTAETIGVSCAPSPSPRKPPPGMHLLAAPGHL